MRGGGKVGTCCFDSAIADFSPLRYFIDYSVHSRQSIPQLRDEFAGVVYS